jgi:sugar phosphate isomerase/epimerase
MDLLMETGQESAPELLQFLNDLRCKNVKVNFDPANMILYGAGDPIEAIGILGRHIAHVHVKDATMSKQPSVDWGAEVPFGAGQVPAKDFLRALHDVGYRGPLVIEREAGATRMADIAFAIETLKSAGATA